MTVKNVRRLTVLLTVLFIIAILSFIMAIIGLLIVAQPARAEGLRARKPSAAVVIIHGRTTTNGDSSWQLFWYITREDGKPLVLNGRLMQGWVEAKPRGLWNYYELAVYLPPGEYWFHLERTCIDDGWSILKTVKSGPNYVRIDAWW